MESMDDLISTSAADSVETAKAAVASAAATGAGMASSSSLPHDATRAETVLISYFRIFVYALFPPAGVLLLLLMTPLPRSLQKSVVNLCDGVLFWQPHARVPLSLFSLVVGISALTLLVVLQDLFTLREQYEASPDKPERTLVRILAEERNAWISASCIALWSIAHRFRSLMRKYHDAVGSGDEKASSSAGTTTTNTVMRPSLLPTTTTSSGQPSKTTTTTTAPLNEEPKVETPPQAAPLEPAAMQPSSAKPPVDAQQDDNSVDATKKKNPELQEQVEGEQGKEGLKDKDANATLGTLVESKESEEEPITSTVTMPAPKQMADAKQPPSTSTAGTSTDAAISS